MKRKIQIMFALIGVLISFNACKTYKASMSNADYAPVPQMLPNMKLDFKDLGNNVGGNPDFIKTIVTKEFEKNIIPENGLPQGRVEIDLDHFNLKQGSGMLYVSAFTLYTINLLGVPLCAPIKSDVGLTFKIYDSNNNLLKSYSYSDAKQTAMGLYYGKDCAVLTCEITKGLLKRFKEDYNRDATTLVAALNSSINTYTPQYTSNSKYKTANQPTASSLATQTHPTTLQTAIKEYGTIVISYPANKMVGLGELSIYCSINDSLVGTLRTREYFEVKVNPGAYVVSLAPTGNGLVNWSYNEAKYGRYALTFPKFEIKNGEKVYIVLPKKTISSESAFNGRKSYFLAQKSIDISTPIEDMSHQLYASSSQNGHSVSVVDSNIPQTKINSEKTYALIIANENYQYIDPVNFALKDGKIFKEYCINTLGIPEKQIFYYDNATYGRIVDGVEKLKYCLNNFENSKAIVYYCGHGIPDEKTGQAYLIPVDGKGTNMTTCYSLKNLYKTLAATKAQSITYFMDACFTGANKEGSMLVAARGVAREPVKETLAGKTVVFSASSGDETAMTLEEQGHGLFTYYLLKKLQETEGNVTYGELADYINKNVKKDAFLINEKPQTPVVATSPAVQNTWKTMKLK